MRNSIVAATAVVAALALGGDEKKSPVEAVQAREGLSILAQLSPVQTYGLGVGYQRPRLRAGAGR